jgi:predicted permease
VEILWQDLRYAARGFRRNLAFTLTAILAIALGVGATTAVFSVVDRVLFRSLPYAEPDRLVSVGLVAPIEAQEFMLGADYLEWREQQTPFAGFTSWSGVGDCDLTDQNPERVRCARVESNFLRTFGIMTALGRSFTSEEDRPQSPLAVLVTHGLWQSRFGGTTSVVGRTISLDGRLATVVGVLPQDFELPNLAAADLVIPQALDEARQQRPGTGQVLRSFARLKPGVTVEQAQAALQPLFESSLQWVPAPFRKEVKLSVRSLHERQVQDAHRVSWMLLAAVLAVLLIACANVANLLLARGAGREREWAIRAALGAGYGRLLRQRFTECAFLGVLGCVAGCTLAAILLRSFIAIAPEGIPRLREAALDPRVLGFALITSLAAGLIFGLASALRRPRTVALTDRSMGLAPKRLRSALVMLQVAASVVLLAGAGLLLRSLIHLQGAPTGLQAGGVVTARVVLNRHRYPERAQQAQFFERLEIGLQALPGVGAMGLSDSLPPAGQARFTLFAAVEVQGWPRFAEGTGGTVTWRSVTPGYFAALGIPIVRGRGFTEDDRRPTENAAILSESLAQRLFAGKEVLGRQLRFGLAGPWYTVVGVAANVKNAGLREPGEPEYYLAWKHGLDYARDHSVAILRTGLPPEAVAGWVREQVASLDPALPVKVETMRERLRELAQRPRFNALLLTIFAGMGVSLAAIGIYGVLAYLVAQRTQEFGVRMALGGAPRDMLLLVLGRGIQLTTIGMTIGMVTAMATTHLLRSMLFKVTPLDPVTLLGVSLVLGLTATAACYFPARRAMRVDPAVALRHE